MTARAVSPRRKVTDTSLELAKKEDDGRTFPPHLLPIHDVNVRGQWRGASADGPRLHLFFGEGDETFDLA